VGKGLKASLFKSSEILELVDGVFGTIKFMEDWPTVSNDVRIREVAFFPIFYKLICSKQAIWPTCGCPLLKKAQNLLGKTAW
jgi:hypothetical protein